MGKPVIAIDVDDVLSSQIEVFIEFSNIYFGTSLTLDDFQEPGEYWSYYSQIWKISKEEGDRRYRQFIEAGYPVRQAITDEVKDAIERLRQHYTLEIVTSRDAETSEPTKEWLLAYFPDVFRGIHFTTLWDETSKQVSKARICQEIGASYLIDDNAEHCNLAAEIGVKSLLFGEWGWNKYQDLHPEVLRVDNWKSVLEFFNV